MNPKWELLLMEKKNPVHTAAFLNGYDSREFSPETVIARESAQNSMDAGRNERGITEVQYRELRIGGANKTKLLSLLHLDTLISSKLDSWSQSNRNRSFVDNAEHLLNDDQICALLISDRNTCGLGGALNRYDKGDHFSRLVCALNFDDKADDNDNSGGSYGLGKTAYAKSSRINTVLYHSTFKADKASQGASRRLMVSGVFPRHDNFGGFAYFGEQDPDDETAAVPFENDNALKMWEQISDLFGIDAKRPDNEYGTDVLILMSNVDFASIRKSIEDYYFPAIVKKEIAFKFIDADNVETFPRPLERNDLDQFVKLFKELEAGTELTTTDKLLSKFRAEQNHKMGKFAFAAAEPDEADSELANSVAIIRGTNMVINYMKIGSDRYEPAVGVYVADEEIYKYLIASENAAHSEWNEKSPRLERDFPIVGPAIVKSLNKRLKDRFFNFQKDLQPDVAKSRSESGLLSKLLSNALSGGPGDAPPPPGMPNPVSISLQQTAREESISRWRLLVQSNEHTPEKPFQLNIMPSISLAGEKMIKLRHMEFTVAKDNGEILAKGTKPELAFSFEQGSVIDLIVSYSDPGRQNFVVSSKFVAQVERPE